MFSHRLFLVGKRGNQCFIYNNINKESLFYKKRGGVNVTNVELYNETIFDSIKHIDENGNEYWLARELMPLLEYSKWENFIK